MTTRTDQPIIRFVPADRLVDVLETYGARRFISGPVQPDAVCALADEYRSDNEHDGSALADALLALIEEVKSTPVDDWDQPNPTDAHRDLFREWEGRARGRSPLLEPLADALNKLWCAKDPGVVHARRALEVLVDANKILPGVDEALRYPLSEYAGV